MKKTILLKINKDLPPNYKVGDQVSTPVDCDGVIKDQFLRKRLEDARIDKCLTVVQEPTRVVNVKNKVSSKEGEK